MAIKQYEKIVASEIKAATGINVTSGNYIKAADISSLYSGTDTIAPGVLIKAEHFISIGIPGTNGLNGTYGGKAFTEAIKSGWIEYDGTNNILKILTSDENNGSTLKFTNFGKFSSTSNIFMIGGGGAGNNKGYDGNGGDYITNKTKNLELNKTYTLKIGKGGASNGANGTNTVGFDETATGGVGGSEAVVVNYRTRQVKNGNWELVETEDTTRETEDGIKFYQIKKGSLEKKNPGDYVHTRYTYDKEGNIIDEVSETPISEGNNEPLRYNCVKDYTPHFYYISLGNSQSNPGVLKTGIGSERQDEGAESIEFSGTTYGGSGGTNSGITIVRGQGGFSTFTNPNEANVANSGGNGIILIKFTNK